MQSDNEDQKKNRETKKNIFPLKNFEKENDPKNSPPFLSSFSVHSDLSNTLHPVLTEKKVSNKSSDTGEQEELKIDSSHSPKIENHPFSSLDSLSSSSNDVEESENEEDVDDEEEEDEDDDEEDENFQQKLNGKFNFKIGEKEISKKTEIIEIEDFLELYFSEKNNNRKNKFKKKIESNEENKGEEGNERDGVDDDHVFSFKKRKFESQFLLSMKMKKRSLLLKYLKKEKLRKRMVEMSPPTFLKLFGISKNQLFLDDTLDDSPSVSSSSSSSPSHPPLSNFDHKNSKKIEKNDFSSKFPSKFEKNHFSYPVQQENYDLKNDFPFSFNNEQKKPSAEKKTEKIGKKTEKKILSFEEKLKNWSDYPLAINDNDGNGFWKKLKEEKEKEREKYRKQNDSHNFMIEKFERQKIDRLQKFQRKFDKKNLIQKKIFEMKVEGQKIAQKRKEDKLINFRLKRIDKRFLIFLLFFFLIFFFKYLFKYFFFFLIKFIFYSFFFFYFLFIFYFILFIYFFFF